MPDPDKFTWHAGDIDIEPEADTPDELPPQESPPKKTLLDHVSEMVQRISAPVIHVAPAAVQVDVQPQAITVEGAHVDVHVPETKVDVAAPIVHVAPPVVNVKAPKVDVHVPEPKPRKERRTVTRDPSTQLVTKIEIEET